MALPNADDENLSNLSLLVRTDFSNDDAWSRLQESLAQPSIVDGFKANLYFVSSPESYDQAPIPAVLAAARAAGFMYFFIADQQTISEPEQAILVVDCETEASFRVLPRAMWDVENNLSICNCDFEDYLADLNASGVYTASWMDAVPPRNNNAAPVDE